MKAGGLKVVYDGLEKFKEALKLLSSTNVLIGIPEQKSEREEDTPITNAAIGYINENGSDLNNIPPRPHLVPGIKKVQTEITEEFKKAALKAFSNPGAVVQHFTRAGIIASNSVKKIITSQDGFEEISEATKKARENNNFKGEKALIVTGQYRNAITYVIDEGDK